MQSITSKPVEQYLFYIEISEFDNELILWSGYCTGDFKVNEKKIVFYNVFGEWKNQFPSPKKNICNMYDINLYFLNREKEYFGVSSYGTESFVVKEGELSFEINDETFDLDYFKIDLIKKYRENKISLRDWCKLNNEEKNDWIRVSYWIQQYKPMRLTSLIVIDGRYIKSLNDFLCYIGEEVNGVMGYFGSSFGSLSDSLTGGIGGVIVPLHITWYFFEETKRQFDSQDDLTYLIELLNQVTIVNYQS